MAKVKPFIEQLATMRFVIDDAGRPTQLDVAADDATFRACITKVVSGMTLIRTSGSVGARRETGGFTREPPTSCA